MSTATRRKYNIAKNRSYNADFYGWALDQVSLLNREQPSTLDWKNIIEEKMAAARNEERALGSHLRVMLIHLLKWRYAFDERNKGSWQASLMNSRDEIQDLLRRSPGLNPELDYTLSAAYKRARRTAGAQLGLDRRGWDSKLPDKCEWSLEQLLDPDFWPAPI
jgi:hypothetical protein